MLPSFDEMLKMSNEQLTELQQTEVKAVLDAVDDKERRKKLEMLNSNIQLRLRAKRLNYITLWNEMQVSFHTLNQYLNSALGRH